MLGRRWAQLVVLAMVLGCGPVEYVGQVTRRASGAVAAAKSARADQLAPYEYTLANEYLHKAREEASYSDFQAALRFGRKARVAAERATELAIARAADPDLAARELPPANLPQPGAKPFAPLDEPSDESGVEEVPQALENEP